MTQHQDPGVVPHRAVFSQRKSKTASARVRTPDWGATQSRSPESILSIRSTRSTRVGALPWNTMLPSSQKQS